MNMLELVNQLLDKSFESETEAVHYLINGKVLDDFYNCNKDYIYFMDSVAQQQLSYKDTEYLNNVRNTFCSTLLLGGYEINKYKNSESKIAYNKLYSLFSTFDLVAFNKNVASTLNDGEYFEALNNYVKECTSKQKAHFRYLMDFVISMDAREDLNKVPISDSVTFGVEQDVNGQLYQGKLILSRLELMTIIVSLITYNNKNNPSWEFTPEENDTIKEELNKKFKYNYGIKFKNTVEDNNNINEVLYFIETNIFPVLGVLGEESTDKISKELDELVNFYRKSIKKKTLYKEIEEQELDYNGLDKITVALAMAFNREDIDLMRKVTYVCHLRKKLI